MKKKIAVTGGIGSGKSTLLQFIREAGYPVFSCDELYKEILQTPAYVEKIAARFPQCVTEGEIDKRKLAATVFQNETERLALNAIAHPLVMQALDEKMEQQTEPLVFAEVPLLFEGGYQELFDKVIVLLREERARISSVVHRDNLLKKEVEDRISSQLDYNSKRAQELFQADSVIVLYNDQTEKELKNKINALLLDWK